MNETDEIRLRHMLRAAKEAISFVKGRARMDLDTDTMLVRAVWRTIQEDLPLIVAALEEVLPTQD